MSVVSDNEVGPGPLSRGAATVYRFMVVEALIVLTVLPTLVVFVFLERDASNLPLYVLALLPVGPALSAALYALRAGAAAPDLTPSRPFWRGYRLNVRAVLAWWVPFLAVAAVLAVNVAGLDLVPGGTVIRPLLVLLAVAGLVWAAHMLVITAFFDFQTRDSARIAAWALGAHWRVSLAALATAVLAAALIHLATEAVLLLLAAPLAGLLWLGARPLVTDITARFTHHEEVHPQ